MTPSTGSRRTRRPGAARRVRPLRILLPLLLLGAAVFLYARPLSDYADTRADLSARQQSVASLRATKAELVAQLERTTSLDALARQARAIGYVKPGERLYIVKGIPAWRRALRATVSGDGRP